VGLPSIYSSSSNTSKRVGVSPFLRRHDLLSISTRRAAEAPRLSKKLVYPMAGLTAQMVSALDATDLIRKEANGQLDPKRKSALGQFMTPSTVAKYMASLFRARPASIIRLLDPGAGVGSLTAAFLDRFLAGEGVEQIEIAAYEVDEVLQKYLTGTLKEYRAPARASGVEIHSNVIADDFIDAMCRPLLRGVQPRFTHAILNPPYKKIHSDSDHRIMLRQAGIETVNLYTAFLALTIEAMEDGGEIVAIVPRSALAFKRKTRRVGHVRFLRACVARHHRHGGSPRCFRSFHFSGQA
jgi:adenine-specific DNA-methyltransferase